MILNLLIFNIYKLQQQHSTYDINTALTTSTKHLRHRHNDIFVYPPWGRWRHPSLSGAQLHHGVCHDSHRCYRRNTQCCAMAVWLWRRRNNPIPNLRWPHRSSSGLWVSVDNFCSHDLKKKISSSMWGLLLLSFVGGAHLQKNKLKYLN